MSMLQERLNRLSGLPEDREQLNCWNSFNFQKTFEAVSLGLFQLNPFNWTVLLKLTEGIFSFIKFYYVFINITKNASDEVVVNTTKALMRDHRKQLAVER